MCIAAQIYIYITYAYAYIIIWLHKCVPYMGSDSLTNWDARGSISHGSVLCGPQFAAESNFDPLKTLHRVFLNWKLVISGG